MIPTTIPAGTPITFPSPRSGAIVEGLAAHDHGTYVTAYWDEGGARLATGMFKGMIDCPGLAADPTPSPSPARGGEEHGQLAMFDLAGAGSPLPVDKADTGGQLEMLIDPLEEAQAAAEALRRLPPPTIEELASRGMSLPPCLGKGPPPPGTPDKSGSSTSPVATGAGSALDDDDTDAIAMRLAVVCWHGVRCCRLARVTTGAVASWRRAGFGIEEITQ